MKNNFKNYDTEKIGAILLGLMAIFIGAGFITFSHSLYISVLSVLAINLIAIFVLIYIIILPALDRNYKHIYFIGGDYIQECDINIVSRILMNISKMTGLDAISLFAEKEYLQFNSYVCSGDYDIQYFIDTILKGVSNRHYIQVKCSGHNRQVAIDFCDINKKMCIYITNADGRQFISFRPLTSAQTLGLIDISSKSSESKAIRFNSPVRIHNILTCILIASLIIMTIYLTYNPIRQSEFGVIVFIMLWALAYIANRHSITKLTQLPSDITSNLSNNTIEKNKIIDKIVNSIINIYGLNDNAEYIKDVFDAHKFIYGGNIIFCKSESELESVIKSCLADYNYKLAIAYGSNDRISAGITIAENNISIILSVTKLDNGQIISIE